MLIAECWFEKAASYEVWLQFPATTCACCSLSDGFIKQICKRGSKAWKIFRKLLELETRRSLIHPAPFQNHTPLQKNMFEKRIWRQQMAQGFQGISGFQRVIGFSYFNRRRWNSENSNLSRMDIFWHNSRILKKWQKPAAFRDLNINQLYQYKIFMSFYKADHPQTNVCEMGYMFWGRFQIFWLSTTDEIQWFSKIDIQSNFWRSGNSILGLLQWWWWWWWWGSSSS